MFSDLVHQSNETHYAAENKRDDLDKQKILVYSLWPVFVSITKGRSMFSKIPLALNRVGFYLYMGALKSGP